MGCFELDENEDGVQQIHYLGLAEYEEHNSGKMTWQPIGSTLISARACTFMWRKPCCKYHVPLSNKYRNPQFQPANPINFQWLKVQKARRPKFRSN